ncbi:MAG: hypothetical protein B7C24_09900 [Bacteroidetes bacterium 4572_77]|nr:MAG: hypothetical protein B7C24_09900 [Bacteroidetes bacterium 4572_77]
MNNLLIKAESQQILRGFTRTSEDIIVSKKVLGVNYNANYYSSAPWPEPYEENFLANLDFGRTIVTEDSGDGSQTRISYFFDSNNNHVNKIKIGYDVIYSKPYIISVHNSIYYDKRVRRINPKTYKTTVYDIRNLRKIYENSNAIRAIIFSN